MGALLSVMRITFDFITGLPFNLVCIAKVVIMGFITLLLRLPGIDYLVTFQVNWPRFLLGVMQRFLTFIYYTTVGGVLYVADMGASAIAGHKKGSGAYFRSVMRTVRSCENDPRSWYRRGNWHRGSRYGRLMGFGACACPCGGSYRPSWGGLLCSRAPGDAPQRCPIAAITYAYEAGGKGALSRGRPPPLALTGGESASVAFVYRSSCGSLAVPPTAAQVRLAETVCQQAPELPGGADRDLADMCYEAFCSGAEEYGAQRRPFCSRLVPRDSGKEAETRAEVTLLAGIAVALVAAPSLLAVARLATDAFVMQNSPSPA